MGISIGIATSGLLGKIGVLWGHRSGFALMAGNCCSCDGNARAIAANNSLRGIGCGSKATPLRLGYRPLAGR